MSLRAIFCRNVPAELPHFVRALEDREGVRILRLQGPVGKDIAADIKPAEERQSDRLDYDGSLLLDFSGTTGSDFSTVSYLVLALRERLARSGRVGILHAPPQLLTEMKLARVDAMFPVYDSEENAVRDLAKPATPA